MTSPSRKLVDVTKWECYRGLLENKHRVVVSNDIEDIVCHALVFVAGSDYFFEMFKSCTDKMEISPGQVVSRMFVNFDSNLLYSYIEFCYTKNVELHNFDYTLKLMEFFDLISSVEILKVIEKNVPKLSLSEKQSKTMLKHCKDYGLKDLERTLKSALQVMDTDRNIAIAMATEDSSDDVV